MFKWACLGVAVVFLSAVLWLLNDIRVQVRQSGRVVDDAGQTVNAELPVIVQRTRSTSEIVAKNLPDVVKRIDRTTEVVAELAEDIRQLKELAGLKAVPRDKNVVAYAESVLQKVAASGGEIGVKKTIGKGLKNTRPATEWVDAERREAALMAILGRSKKQMLQSIVTTKLGFYWYIQLPGKQPVRLLDWLKENHEETRNLAVRAPAPARESAA
jgi:hypothetical protein